MVKSESAAVDKCRRLRSFCQCEGWYLKTLKKGIKKKKNNVHIEAQEMTLGEGLRKRLEKRMQDG